MQNKNGGKLALFLSEGILIALGSASVYLITYFYELGYCDYFGIPAIFINPNITTILVAAAAIGGLIFSSLQFIGFSLPLFRAALNGNEDSKPFRLFFLINALLFILGVILLKAYGITVKGFSFFIALLMGINFFLFGIGLIIHRKRPSLREKFQAMENTNKDPFNIWDVIFDTFGWRTATIILVLICTAWLGYIIGNGEALRQKRFLVFKEPSDYVLLRTYGDLMIAAPVNRITKLIGNEFLMIRTATKEKLEFKSEIVGPLEKQPDVIEKTPENQSKATAQPKVSQPGNLIINRVQ